jgi:integrase
MDYLFRRNGTYYARLHVPEELQELVGKADRWKSLKTSDLREAKLRAPAIVARWREEDELIRRKRIMTEDDLKAARWDHYTRELDHDAKRRLSFLSAEKIKAAEEALKRAGEAIPEGDFEHFDLSPAAFDLWIDRGARDIDRNSRADRAALLKKHLAEGETFSVEAAADAFIERERLLIDRDSLGYKHLCQSIQRAELAALGQAAERDKGDFAGVPSDPTIAPPQPGSTPQRAAPGESIMELWAQFKAEKSASVTVDTWNQNERTMAIFAEFVGTTAHISAVNRKTVRDWKQHLLRYPARATDPKKTAFKGMSFREAVKANATVGQPTIADKTVNRYLSALGKFCGWLLQNEYLDADPVRGLLLEIDKKTKKVRPHTADQLVTIFASPLFVGCAGDGREHVVGKVKVRDWRYWLPIIAIYSGARLGEIAQLHVADIREERGVWIFHITPEGGEGGDEKTVKTEGSARVVPIHPRLVELGLLAYHAQMKERGETRLFPTAERDSRRHFGAASRFFGKYFEKIGVKGDRSSNFHSFRHGVADAFRRAEYLDEQFGLLLGHTGGTTTGRYGMLPQGELMQRKKMIDAIDYPGLSPLS